VRALRNSALIVWLVALCPARAAAQPLKSYSIDRHKIFVAGVSSGAAMAVQLTVAHSATFKGAAIYAGLPYYCAGYDLLSAARAASGCSVAEPRDRLSHLEDIAESWAQSGLIDPLQNLQNKPVYLWSGRSDRTVRQAVSNQLETLFSHFGSHIFQYDNQFKAGHGWESPYGSVPCGETASPYVNRCQDPSNHRPYDSEEVWLGHFFGTLKPKNRGNLNGSLVSFAQNQFAPHADAASISLARTGFVFVPLSCESGAGCGLVLALHGCAQNFAAVGKTFMNEAGLNQWADSNDVVVLYPQAATSLNNPLACWDWWGYLSDPDYAQKNGPQMKALYQMVLRVSGSTTPATTK
jgi:poly(3-hydroxybutyrate) depolymerase